MSHLIFRIEVAKFAGQAREGIGAERYGARWNSPGRPAVYCASTLSLGILEILAHLTPKSRSSPRVYFPVHLDELAVQVVHRRALPARLAGETDMAITQAIGDEWLIRAATVALKVPSVMVPGEFNFILNPAHPDYAAAAIWGRCAPLELDRRIMVGVPKRTRRGGRRSFQSRLLRKAAAQAAPLSKD